MLLRFGRILAKNRGGKRVEEDKEEEAAVGSGGPYRNTVSRKRRRVINHNRVRWQEVENCKQEVQSARKR